MNVARESVARQRAWLRGDGTTSTSEALVVCLDRAGEEEAIEEMGCDETVRSR